MIILCRGYIVSYKRAPLLKTRHNNLNGSGCVRQSGLGAGRGEAGFRDPRRIRHQIHSAHQSHSHRAPGWLTLLQDGPY